MEDLKKRWENSQKDSSSSAESNRLTEEAINRKQLKYHPKAAQFGLLSFLFATISSLVIMGSKNDIEDIIGRSGISVSGGGEIIVSIVTIVIVWFCAWLASYLILTLFGKVAFPCLGGLVVLGWINPYSSIGGWICLLIGVIGGWLLENWVVDNLRKSLYLRYVRRKRYGWIDPELVSLYWRKEIEKYAGDYLCAYGMFWYGIESMSRYGFLKRNRYLDILKNANPSDPELLYWKEQTLKGNIIAENKGNFLKILGQYPLGFSCPFPKILSGN